MWAKGNRLYEFCAGLAAASKASGLAAGGQHPHTAALFPPIAPAQPHPPWSLAKMSGSILRMVPGAPSTSNCLQVSSIAMLSCTSLMVEEASSCAGEKGGRRERERLGES